MSKRNLALIGATIVSIIYGVTFTIAKDVMPLYIDAYGFILLRVGGSVIIFWLVWLFMPKEKILLSDFPRIIAAAFFGVAFNMLTFFKGLSLTSPISAAVIMVSTPMIVLTLSALIMKERMQKRMVFGILLGLIGTAFLILYGKSIGSATNAGLGNFLVLVNAISYGYYLIIVKKLMDKYNAFTFVNGELGFGSNEYLLENSICCSYFDFSDVFAEFTFDEGIETYNRCCFYLFATPIRHCFCDKLG